jgi:methyl-accepting chemotaxis protein
MTAGHWTFGQKVSAAFAFSVALTIAICVISILALHNVVEGKDEVITVFGENMIDAEKLAATGAWKTNAFRGFLLDKQDRHLGEAREYREEFRETLTRLRARSVSGEERALLDRVERAEAEHQTASERVIEMLKNNAPPDTIARAFSEQVISKKDVLVRALEAFSMNEQRLRDDAKQASSDAASTAVASVTSVALIAMAFAIAVAILLTRTLGRQIGVAVGQVQSSSAELQTAATQQATGVKEQSTAMNEISTTISELLAASRQIAEGAQRVASVAEQTLNAARSGNAGMKNSSDAVAGIRRQMDLIVNHMLELGKKSQQIGGVLEIVSELAEQTNILAINATVEAVGAGESGKRFAVVADEIRKLADRVAGSAKEIRGLIEDVRGAVNATVMQTETGSKAVDAGAQQIAEVATSLMQIANLVTTTTESAREIELSTKQQTTAVEQVNIAIANVTQTTKETEASSGQTLQTASQLALLSGELLRLVRPQNSFNAAR